MAVALWLVGVVLPWSPLAADQVLGPYHKARVLHRMGLAEEQRCVEAYPSMGLERTSNQALAHICY